MCVSNLIEETSYPLNCRTRTDSSPLLPFPPPLLLPPPSFPLPALLPCPPPPLHPPPPHALLQMLVRQKEANRQSMLLLQSSEPSVQLLKALEDVATITKTLEEERLQHRQEVKQLHL